VPVAEPVTDIEPNVAVTAPKEPLIYALLFASNTTDEAPTAFVDSWTCNTQSTLPFASLFTSTTSFVPAMVTLVDPNVVFDVIAPNA
jgi:hypothetical protein